MAEAAAAPFPKASPAVRLDPDPLAAHAITGAVAALLATLIVRRSDSLVETVSAEWPSLLFWTLLVVVVNLVPVRVEDLRLTLDLPLLLAVAFLWPAEVAALVAVLGSFDSREVSKGRVGLSRALFNRCQIGLSIYLAAAVFHFLAGSLEPLGVASVAALAGLAVDYAANTGLVSFHLAARRRLGLKTAISKLTVGRVGQFLVAYLGYGVLALVVAHVYLKIGAWSVVAFLLPIVVARQMLVRGQESLRANMT